MTKPTCQKSGGKRSKEEVIAELKAEWDRKLGWLRQPGAHEKIESVLRADGRTKVRPKAGPSY